MKRYLCALLICSSCIEGLPSAQTMSFTGELVGPPTYDKRTLAGGTEGCNGAILRRAGCVSHRVHNDEVLNEAGMFGTDVQN